MCWPRARTPSTPASPARGAPSTTPPGSGVAALGPGVRPGFPPPPPLPAPPGAHYPLLDPRAAVPPAAPPGGAALTLIATPPYAAAGFDSQRMVYLREPDRREYFAE